MVVNTEKFKETSKF